MEISIYSKAYTEMSDPLRPLCTQAVLPVIGTPKSWFFGPYDGDECLA